MKRIIISIFTTIEFIILLSYQLGSAVSGNRKESETLAVQHGVVSSADFSPDGRLLASSGESKLIEIWDVKTRKRLSMLSGHLGIVRSVAFSPDGNLLASASSDRTINLWDTKDMKQPIMLGRHLGEVNLIAFSPDSNLLASAGSDRALKLWNVKSRRWLADLIRSGQSREIKSIAFSSDGSLLANTSGKDIILWDTKNYKVAGTLIGHQEIIESIAFSQSGNLLASGGNEVILWNIYDKNILAKLPNLRASSVAFSPNDAILAIGGWGNIKLWDVNNKRELETLTGIQDSIKIISFSRDGNLLVSAGKKLIIWNMNSEKESPSSFNLEVKAEFASLPADGKSSTTITATVKDMSEKPLIGKTIQMMVSKGNGMISTAIDNQNGTYTSIYTASTQPGTETITVKTSGLSQKMDIVLNPVSSISIPELAIAKTQVDDSILGNGSGQVETGEIIDLKVTVENISSVTARNVNAKLLNAETDIKIETPNVRLRDIAPGTPITFSFIFSVLPNYEYKELTLLIELTDESGYKLHNEVKLSVKDIEPPNIIIHEPIDNTQTENISIPMKANITDNIMVADVNVKLNGRYIKSEKANKNNFTMDTALSLEPGDNIIIFEAYDGMGNKSEKNISVYMKQPKPDLIVSRITINDTDLENGSVLIETGVTFVFKISVENKGTNIARNVIVRLIYLDTDIQIEPPFFRLGDILPGMTDIGSFTLSISGNYSNEKMALQIELEDEEKHKSVEDLKLHVKDIRKPDIVVYEPVDNHKIDGENINLKADFIDNIRIAKIDIKVNDKTVKSETSSEKKLSINTTVPLEPGNNIIHIEASDPFGNRSEKVILVQKLFPSLKVEYINTLDRFQLGEIIVISISVTNEGTGLARDVSISVASADLSISQIISLGDIASKEQKTLQIPITISDKIKVGMATITSVAFYSNGQKSNEASYVFQIIKKDETPPDIRLINPPLQRGMKIIHEERTMNVKVKAIDESGIRKVMVNGQEAVPLKDNEFETILGFGNDKSDITLIIVAEDIYNNKSVTDFYIRYEPRLEFVLGEYYALIISVQDYVDPEISDLEFPIQDAQNIMQVLTTEYIFKEENVLLLKNPDRKEIINKLIELKNKLNSDDNLLIYYSGHGHYDEDAKQGYWLPRNANASDPSNWLSNSDIRDRIRTIKTKHTLLITDACFSGAIFEVREAIKPNFSIMELYKRPSRQAITSGNKNTVPDKSVFVEYLMKTLKSNKEKYLTTIELYSRLREPVINNSPVHQTPLHGVILETGDENGDFIFTRR